MKGKATSRSSRFIYVEQEKKPNADKESIYIELLSHIWFKILLINMFAFMKILVSVCILL